MPVAAGRTHPGLGQTGEVGVVVDHGGKAQLGLEDLPEGNLAAFYVRTPDQHSRLGVHQAGGADPDCADAGVEQGTRHFHRHRLHLGGPWQVGASSDASRSRRARQHGRNAILVPPRSIPRVRSTRSFISLCVWSVLRPFPQTTGSASHPGDDCCGSRLETRVPDRSDPAGNPSHQHILPHSPPYPAPFIRVRRTVRWYREEISAYMC